MWAALRKTPEKVDLQKLSNSSSTMRASVAMYGSWTVVQAFWKTTWRVTPRSAE
jgi:hypothetical protein